MPDLDSPTAQGLLDAPRRTPQRKMSDEEKDSIREVLGREDVNYNISLCAQLLDLNYGAVESFVRRDPYLSAKIPEKNASNMIAGENDVIDRRALPPDMTLLTPQQLEEYQKLMRQSRSMLAKDWAALGMTDEQGARMEHFSKIGASPIGQVIRASHGQLITNLDLLEQIIQKDGQMILTGKIPAELKADGTPKDPEMVEREWRYALFAGMRLQLDMFVHMNRTQAMLAQAMKALKASMMNGSSAPRGKLAAVATPPKTTTRDDDGAS